MKLSTLAGLSPIIQALVVAAIFAILIMAACRRKAATNLTAFLRDLGRIIHESSRRQPTPACGDLKRRRHARNHQGQGHEQHHA
jgi:hypothetical protein